MEHIKNFLERFDFLYCVVMQLMIGCWIGSIISFINLKKTFAINTFFTMDTLEIFVENIHYFIFFKRIPNQTFIDNPSALLWWAFAMYVLRWLVSGRDYKSLK